VSRTQPCSDVGFVSAHGGLHQCTLAVAGCLLPLQSAQALNQQQVRVPPAWARLKLRTWLCGYARWNHDIYQWVTLRNGIVGRLSVIRAISSDLNNLLFDLVKQWPHLGRVIDVLLRQYGSNDLTSASIHRQVQLSPATTRLLAMLFKQPFARTKDLQPSAVD